MRYIMLCIVGLYIITGCGGGGSESTPKSDTQTPYTDYYNKSDSGDIVMKRNKSYTVYPGDKIEKNSEDAKVTIIHIDGHKESSVTLISGDAILIRK